MITLECNYSKKLGLPGYSSHQFAITLRTEIADLNQVQAESARLYKLLQEGVDTSIKETGYLPTNGNGNGQRGTATATGQWAQPEPARREWCLELLGQTEDLILKIVEEHKLEKAKVEGLAQDRFGKTVKALNKLEASGLIEELLEMTGQSKGRSRFPGPVSESRWPMIAAVDSVQVHSPAQATPKANPIETLQKTVSASRLNTLLQCRLKFFFRYVQQISKPKTPSLHVGSVVHLILQAWNMARWRKQEFDLEKFKKLFEEGWKDQPTRINWDGEEADEQRKRPGRCWRCTSPRRRSRPTKCLKRSRCRWKRTCRNTDCPH